MDRLEFKSVLTVDDAGTISGVAWPFGTPDRVGDVIHRGAFATAPALVPMLHEHDTKQTVGVWDAIAEAPDGLHVKGRLLISDVQRAREVHALIKAGAITGLSIGFNNAVSTPRQPRGRNIKSLALHEISLVAVPCHSGARITSAKSAHAVSSIVEALARAAQTYRKH